MVGRYSFTAIFYPRTEREIMVKKTDQETAQDKVKKMIMRDFFENLCDQNGIDFEYISERPVLGGEKDGRERQ